MALPKIDVPIYETKLISTGKTVRFRPNMSLSELDIKKAVCLIDTACKNISVRDNYVPLIPF